jgi:hypothetical protein
MFLQMCFVVEDSNFQLHASVCVGVEEEFKASLLNPSYTL